MKHTMKYWLVGALMLGATGVQAALTGVTVSPAVANPGQRLDFTVTASGSACAAKFVLNGLNYYVLPNAKETNGMWTNAPGTPGKTSLLGGIAMPGTYPIVVTGMTGGAFPACAGTVSATLVVQSTTPQVAIPLPGTILNAPLQPLNCPAGYEKTFDNPSKGEIKCRKLPVACPTGFDGSVDANTGNLDCVPKPASCPQGWSGGMQGGVLKCVSAPQPNLSCPKSTPQWQWGTSYYKEGWRIMGCSANLEPPR
jgi:hypothetical protein